MNSITNEELNSIDGGGDWLCDFMDWLLGDLGDYHRPACAS